MLEFLAAETFDVPLPPARPVVVQERLLLSEFAEAKKRQAEYLYNDACEKSDAWAKSLAEKLARLSALPLNVPQSAIENAIFAADRAEATAEILAKELVRFEKMVRRDVKRDFQSDPAFGAVSKMFGAKLIARDKNQIKLLLDAALFLRAWVAERSDPGEIHSFSDPDALMKALLTPVRA